MELYNDDCFNVFPLIKDKVQLFLVDLPYEITGLEWDKKIDLNKMWKHIIPISHTNAIYIFFCNMALGNELINSKKKWFSEDLIWVKNNSTTFFQSKILHLKKHEYILVFKNKRHIRKKEPKRKKYIYNYQKTGEKKDKIKRVISTHKNGIYKGACKETIIDGTKYPTTILKYGYDKKRFHSTQKPQLLLEYLIKTYSNENDIVCDFTMGSGSTGLACKKLNRKFIGIELNKEIFQTAKKRIH